MDFDKLKTDLSKSYERITDYDVMSAAMYPKGGKRLLSSSAAVRARDKLETRHFLGGA